jgi:uncharacterized protein with HEPN domain
MRKDPRVYLAHILESANKIQRYLAGGKKAFLAEENEKKEIDERT